MASEDVQTNLRLPADLKNRLQEAAAENNRSLSAEVTSRLSASFKASSASADLAELFAREALRATESERGMKALLRRSSQMFGLFLGYFRAKGLALSSSEQEDLVELQRDISAVTDGPDIKTLLLSMERLDEKVRFIDQRLTELGSPFDPAKRAEIEALMDEANELRNAYFKGR